jgi:hypothetical protein
MLEWTQKESGNDIPFQQQGLDLAEPKEAERSSLDETLSSEFYSEGLYQKRIEGFRISCFLCAYHTTGHQFPNHL